MQAWSGHNTHNAKKWDIKKKKYIISNTDPYTMKTIQDNMK